MRDLTTAKPNFHNTMKKLRKLEYVIKKHLFFKKTTTLAQDPNQDSSIHDDDISSIAKDNNISKDPKNLMNTSNVMAPIPEANESEEDD